jgi:hypothetical protein
VIFAFPGCRDVPASCEGGDGSGEGALEHPGSGASAAALSGLLHPAHMKVIGSRSGALEARGFTPRVGERQNHGKSAPIGEPRRSVELWSALTPVTARCRGGALVEARKGGARSLPRPRGSIDSFNDEKGWTMTSAATPCAAERSCSTHCGSA